MWGVPILDMLAVSFSGPSVPRRMAACGSWAELELGVPEAVLRNAGSPGRPPRFTFVAVSHPPRSLSLLPYEK